MNGNAPHAQEIGTQAEVDLTPAQRRVLRDGVAAIAAQTRDLLPAEYTVGGEVTRGADGPRVTVAVRPPIGNPVSAGFEPNFAEDDTEPISDSDRTEVAHGLAASAALQVKRAIGDEIPATAR